MNTLRDKDRPILDRIACCSAETPLMRYRAILAQNPGSGPMMKLRDVLPREVTEYEGVAT